MKKSRKIISSMILLLLILIGGVIYYCKAKSIKLTENQIEIATNVYSEYVNAINSNNVKVFNKYSGNNLSFNESKEFINMLDNGDKIVKFDFNRAYKKQGNINYIFDTKFSNTKEMDIVITLNDNKVNQLNVFG